jgi:hypothetical protein
LAKLQGLDNKGALANIAYHPKMVAYSTITWNLTTRIHDIVQVESM